MKLYYDLHMHSSLSPCGCDDMTPNNIVNMACIKELDVIAVTDHNTMLNVPSVIEVAKDKDILVLPGIEVTTKEDIHVLCYFKDINKGLVFQDIIYDSLPDIKNNELIFGEQLLMDSKDNITGKIDKLLLNSSSYNINEICKLVKEYYGIMIPAHVNKNTNSILSNLGFIPNKLKLKTIEKNCDHHKSICDIINGDVYNVITNSDAHYLKDINEQVNFIEVKNRSLECVFNYLCRGV
ncbi:PHP domain-containing protein [Clostridiaceae bacterium M8S5]|nr:PHP domain-containing protein [Clostridiaceae bacterium M8S5]